LTAPLSGATTIQRMATHGLTQLASASDALRLRTATPASGPRSHDRRRRGRPLLAVPAAAFTSAVRAPRDRRRRCCRCRPDEREQLMEAKRGALARWRELDFGTPPATLDADSPICARGTAEGRGHAARPRRAASRLPRKPAPTPARRDAAGGSAALGTAPSRCSCSAWRSASASCGYTEPDACGTPRRGSTSLASLMPRRRTQRPSAPTRRAPRDAEDAAGHARGRRAPVLFAGRYGEAIAAYQAVLKRDPNNVDALTHMGLIAGMARGGARPRDGRPRPRSVRPGARAGPDYPPALLYRGQLLYEAKKDAGARSARGSSSSKSCRPARIGRAWSG